MKRNTFIENEAFVSRRIIMEGEGSGKGGRGMPEATKSLARNGRQDGGQPSEE